MRTTDAAADRRADARAIQLHLCRIECGFCSDHISIGAQLVGARVVAILLAGQLTLEQGLIALRNGTGVGGLGFGTDQHAARATYGSAVSVGIDLIQRLTGLDLAAFGEQTFLQDTGHLRADLCSTCGSHAARQFAIELRRLGLQRDDTYFGYRWWWWRLVLAAIAGSNRADQSRQRHGANERCVHCFFIDPHPVPTGFRRALSHRYL